MVAFDFHFGWIELGEIAKSWHDSTRMLRALVFDLDGVLIDPLPSIHRCMNFALEKMRRPSVDENQVRAWIGPPLEQGAAALLGSDRPEEVAEFIGFYRERYVKTCAQESLPADGLSEVLNALVDRKLLLAVATSKPERYACMILEALGVLSDFKFVCGRSMALNHEEKSAVIARVFEQFSKSGQVMRPPLEAIMVGDRKFDVEGASKHKMGTVGVLHGMGSEDELREAGARWLIPSLRELIPLVDQLRS